MADVLPAIFFGHGNPMNAVQTNTDDFQALVDYESLGKDALLAIPTPDHYLPLLYVMGTRQPDDDVSFPLEGVDGGSISMLCVEVKRRRLHA